MKLNADRQKAIEEGRKTYAGSLCKKCSTREKFVANWGCVACSSSTTTERNKKYWQKLKDSGRNIEFSRKNSHLRKRYYEEHKGEIRDVLIEKKNELGNFYLKKLLIHIKSKCKQKNIPFDVTINDIQVPSHCPILGIELRFNEGGAKDNSPSIDRIVPELGYVKGNVLIISSRANRIKNNATINEMYMIYKFYNDRQVYD